jgi:hypothetical protein
MKDDKEKVESNKTKKAKSKTLIGYILFT